MRYALAGVLWIVTMVALWVLFAQAKDFRLAAEPQVGHCYRALSQGELQDIPCPPPRPTPEGQMREIASAIARTMQISYCDAALEHARYLVEHMPGPTAPISTFHAVCTPCSCDYVETACLKYRLEQAQAKEAQAQALEEHRGALRTLLAQCKTLGPAMPKE